VAQEEIDNYLRNYTAYGNLGLAYAEQGKYEKAAEITRQAIRMATDGRLPRIYNVYDNLALYALALQHLDETRQIIHDAQTRKMHHAISHNSLYALVFLAADSAEMAKQRQWLASQPASENGDWRWPRTRRRMAAI
jgi:tetratricopeptide (TPR) repeat protein